MEKQSKHESTPNLANNLDLTALSTFKLGPSWGKESVKEKKSPPATKNYKDNKYKSENRFKSHVPANDFKQSEEPLSENLKPSIQVLFYPEEPPFKALIKAMQASFKTYELFHLAHLILEKPERFIVILSIKPEATIKHLFVTIPDNLIFTNETDALTQALQNNLNQFFDVQEVEVEAPKGEFKQINVCGLTGELLGPSNYHKYQVLLQEHYNTRLSATSYKTFLASITTTKEADTIAAWIDKMSKSRLYVLKSSPTDAPVTFESLEAARNYLKTNHLSKLIKSVTNVRINGKTIEKLPTNIKNLIHLERTQQLNFPLVTVNNMRKRLRKEGFFIYKRGSKGISYVSAVKRKYRMPDTVFAEPIKRLIEFIEQNPLISIMDLPFKYLNLPVQAEGVTQTLADLLVSSPEAQEIMKNIRWLVMEGYITEYEKGSLAAAPVLNSASKENASKEDALIDSTEGEKSE